MLYWRRALGFLAAVCVIGMLVGSGLAFSNFTAAVSEDRRTVDQRDQTECPEGADCDRRDLVAQVRSADAAESLFDISVWQFWLAVAGTAAVSASLYFTALATRAAAEAAKLARKAIEKDTVVQRAWITLEPPRISTTRLQDGTLYFQFAISWRNTGGTPALAVAAYTAIDVMPAETDRDQHTALGPGQVFNSPAQNFEAGEMFQGRLASVSGVVIYTDIFERDLVRRSEAILEIRYASYTDPYDLAREKNEIPGSAFEVSVRRQTAS